MPQFSHTVYFIKHRLHPNHAFWKPLRYPELSRFAPDDAPISNQLLQRIEEITTELDHGKIANRRVPAEPEIFSTSIECVPTESAIKEQLWREPLSLNFEVVVWQPDDEHSLGYVPALDIHILAPGKPDGNFVGIVKSEIRNALARREVLGSLGNLARVDRVGKVSLHPHTYELKLPTVKSIAQKQGADELKHETLRKVAVRSEFASMYRAFQLEEPLEHLAQFLSLPGPQSVLIVGPNGCGKTSLVRELAKRRHEKNFGETLFWETAGSRIVAGMSGFGQWQERCEALIQDLGVGNNIIHVGNLVELLDVGKSEYQSEGIASFLRPYIQKGQVLAVAECTPEQIAVIEKQDPQLLGAFVRLEMQAPDAEQSTAILSDDSNLQTSSKRWKSKGHRIDSAAIDTIVSLHQRYATYSAKPARAVQFLRNLIRDTDHDISTEDVIRQFSSESGLPSFLLSHQRPLNLKETHDWFSSRVIGQPEPVDLVVDLLASVKSGMTPMGKPIASLLFIGPTGVGKTEMAKSIAEFMYSDPNRMVRFDMSEYADRLSVERLIGGVSSKDGILTSKVRQNPFTVLLLDEFEKAHPSFFDLLLQVLGEGRLTDGQGRVTDFSTTIVLMTSNLGAQTFRQSGLGFSEGRTNNDQTSQRAAEHFSREVQKFIRPELFNRLDRVIPFHPLSQSTIQLVTRRELEKLRQREGIWFRAVDLEITDEATSWIAQNGYDQKYGARPLQRFLQQNVVVPLANRLNDYAEKGTIVAKVSIEGGQLQIATKMIPQKKSDSTNMKRVETSIAHAQNVRRRTQAFVSSPIVTRLENEFFRLKQQFERREKLIQKLTRAEIAKLPYLDDQELYRYEDLHNRIKSLEADALSFERKTMEDFYLKRNVDNHSVSSNADAVLRRNNELLFEVFTFESAKPQTVTLLLYSRHIEPLRWMSEAYLDFARSREVGVRAHVIERFKKDDPKATGVLSTLKQDIDPALFHQLASNFHDGEVRESIQKSTDKFANVYFASNILERLHESIAGIIGVAFSFSGKAAFPMFANERGVHLFRDKKKMEVFVTTDGDNLISRLVEPAVGTLGPFEFDTPTRRYDNTRDWIEDKRVGKIPVTEPRIATGITKCLQLALDQHLESLIESWN